MLELKLDFTWYKDASGYTLVAAKPIALRRGRSILDIPSREIRPARIVRNGGKLQPYRPLDDYPPNLFKLFIEEATSEEDVFEFVKKFGPLTYEGLQEKGDVVWKVIDQAQSMSKILRGEIVALPLNRLIASIHTDRKAGIRLNVRPACLLDALWLQLARQSPSTSFVNAAIAKSNSWQAQGPSEEPMQSFVPLNAKRDISVSIGPDNETARHHQVPLFPAPTAFGTLSAAILLAVNAASPLRRFVERERKLSGNW